MNDVSICAEELRPGDMFVRKIHNHLDPDVITFTVISACTVKLYLTAEIHVRILVTHSTAHRQVHMKTWCLQRTDRATFDRVIVKSLDAVTVTDPTRSKEEEKA